MTQYALSIDEVLKATGLGRTKIYELINSGELKARKCGRRTIIPVAELEGWIESLPKFSHAE